MSAIDSGLADVALGASDSAADSGSASVEQTDVTTSTDSTVENAPVEGAESTEEEISTTKEDGTEKTEEEIAQEKTERAAAAKGGAKDVLPQEARNALKALRDLDPKYAGVVKTLHNAFERFSALQPLLGSEGVSGVKAFLSEANVKNLSELRQSYAEQSRSIDAVKSTDELLYAGDGQLWKNVVDDLEASGHPEALGKLASSFIQTLKEHDLDSFYSEISKPTVLAGLEESGFVSALNQAYAAIDSDPKSAKAVLASIGKWFSDLREESSEKSKISKERAAWNSEREAATKSEETKARTAVENGIAEECDKYNNRALGKVLGTYLKMPFFKGFERPTLVVMGNQIKGNLYEALKADKQYQTQMSAMWKQKSPDRDKMTKYHNAKLDSIAADIVRSTVQTMYPGYARGGSAAGRVASMEAAKATQKAADTKAQATGRAQYVPNEAHGLLNQGQGYVWQQSVRVERPRIADYYREGFHQGAERAKAYHVAEVVLPQ